MNDHYTGAVAGNAVDAANIRAFLQQAVDHYPRLAAFSFTALLPRRETPEGNQALILRFHTEVWHRIGEYSWQRQQARRHSPPTILRWIWESVSAAECKMVLLMNFYTLGAMRETPTGDGVVQEIYALVRDAWRRVTKADDDIVHITSLFISRSGNGAFTAPFNRLQASVQEMASPVMVARTGVVCS